MTREQLIEAMARAGIRAGIQSEELARCVAVFMPSAIEAAGLCIVPREATDAMIDAGLDVDGGGNDDPDNRAIQSATYRAMITAGRL